MSGKGKGRALRVISSYVGAYLLGILTCVLLTPAEVTLAGVSMWPLYPGFACVGFFLYFLYLSPPYAPWTGYWLPLSLALLPVVAEVAVHFLGGKRVKAWRPLWVGFPIGFVGTLGVYYTAAASI